VPFEAFLKGTNDKDLAHDYGEQQREVERYSRFFRNRVLLDEFKDQLWKLGERSHPIFQNR